METNVLDWLETTAAACPDKPAFLDEDSAVTFADVRREARIIGTAAAEHPELVQEACRAWPGRIAVGIDARDGIVTTRGWVTDAGITAKSLALRMKDLGVTTVIYTDVSRDGMMQGPNVEATKALVEATGLDIIGSGGVSGVADLIRLRDAGCAGAILGKALYEEAIALPEALAAVG